MCWLKKLWSTVILEHLPSVLCGYHLYDHRSQLWFVNKDLAKLGTISGYVHCISSKCQGQNVHIYFLKTSLRNQGRGTIQYRYMQRSNHFISAPPPHHEDINISGTRPLLGHRNTSHTYCGVILNFPITNKHIRHIQHYQIGYLTLLL